MGINENFRWLHIGLPEDVLRLKTCGDFEEALRAIDRRLASRRTPEALRKCLTVQREIIQRLPEDYPLTKEAAVALAQKRIPDFTEAEFDALEADCRVDWIYDHGRKRYFNRWFDSLCKTDASIARRAGITPAGAGGHDPDGHLERAFRAMRETGSASARFRCRASLRMKDEMFHKGEVVRAYLPIPCACDSQSGIVLENISPAPTHVSPEYAPQRVVYWEERMEVNRPFSVEFSYVRTAKYTDLSHPLPSDGERPAFDTGELPPHVLFTPCLRELARTLTEGVRPPAEQARRIYDFITLNVKYAFMRPYFGLENIAENCARNLVGDCGVMALLFITLCRCVGIPARWESGWKAEPGFCGAHDWARFYVAPYGWLYADPSYGAGAVREGDEARQRHYFGSIDPFRMTANTAFQADFDVPKDHWRADPYDNQAGEMETENRGLRYEEFDRNKEVLECQLVV